MQIGTSLRTLRPSPSFEYVAHRGSGHAPENTITAFERGSLDGADRIEFDVRRTQDGEYVVMHDRTLNRTTNGQGAVDGVSLEYIKSLDAGDGAPPPTLQEAVEWAKAKGAKLDIEVKSGDPQEMAAILREADLEDPWVKSFDKGFVDQFADLFPEARTGLLMHPKPVITRSAVGTLAGTGLGLAFSQAASLNPVTSALVGGTIGLMTGFAGGREKMEFQALGSRHEFAMPFHRFASKLFVYRAEDSGKAVVPWTVNSPKRGQKLIERGVSGLITDYPERFVAPEAARPETLVTKVAR